MAQAVQTLEEAREADFRRPPPRTVTTPVFDIHTHIGGKQVKHLIAAARLYGVRGLLGITALETGLRVRRRFPKEVWIATTLDWEHRTDPPHFAEDNAARLTRAAEAGVKVVKLWFAPRIYERFEGLHLDAPLLDPIFDQVAALGMNVLVHISDPDLWFERKYTDAARFGTKTEQYPQLEARLGQHRKIRFLAAHMGGHPEDLEHLGRLLDRHPNLSLDTSATRWMVRELGRQPDAARAFFARYADRILFGTDQVATDKPDPPRYVVRYWIHQMFWETDLVCELPIDDPDADGTPMLRGIALPPAVLERIYYKNAAAWLGDVQIG